MSVAERNPRPLSLSKCLHEHGVSGSCCEYLLVDPIQFRVGLLELAARLLSHLGLRLSVRWVSTAKQENRREKNDYGLGLHALVIA